MNQRNSKTFKNVNHSNSYGTGNVFLSNQNLLFRSKFFKNQKQVFVHEFLRSGGKFRSINEGFPTKYYTKFSLLQVQTDRRVDLLSRCCPSSALSIQVPEQQSKGPQLIQSLPEIAR
uniref:Uncharacterized protein n=2 Tax=Nicotiana TaxID=4085 RepID=A0A1S4DNL7_TOBAC|nr:PREDICTED: uncharacterized protein LOC104240953 [Nicotiana sylvestris]XP_016515013.1 PREDICTED: uncharacterized protein LOC107831727 [Nicotiana tabacum]